MRYPPMLALLMAGGLSIQGCASREEPGHAGTSTASVPHLNQELMNRCDTQNWKLQIPGPLEVTRLEGYSSAYFQPNESGRLNFIVDCAEDGHTSHSEYVRSELRHMAQWRIQDAARLTLSARLSVQSQADPDKVTVLQIHGITDQGGNAPPLLRIALNQGSLYAYIKQDAAGLMTESILLLPRIGTQEFSCAIEAGDGRVVITAGSGIKVVRDCTFWPFANYFKAGCYPQAHKGMVTVQFSQLHVSRGGE